MNYEHKILDVSFVLTDPAGIEDFKAKKKYWTAWAARRDAKFGAKSALLWAAYREELGKHPLLCPPYVKL